MNCKNCNEEIKPDALFCDHCGAKVIKSRITFRFLLTELFAMLGFDSLFFRTLKTMVTKPQVVLQEYLSGVRKKYMNPFAFLAVGAAVAIIIFNLFASKFLNFVDVMDSLGTEQLKELADKDLSTIKNISEAEFLKLQKEQQSAKLRLKFQDFWFESLLKYFNIVTFLFLPVYATMSKWTFRKQNNYGEHIVINAYLQGAAMYLSSITFLLSVFIHPKIYLYSTILIILYYLYTFGKLYNLNFKQKVLKLIRFFFVMIIVFVLVIILSMLLAYLATFLIKTFNPELLNKWMSVTQ